MRIRRPPQVISLSSRWAAKARTSRAMGGGYFFSGSAGLAASAGLGASAGLAAASAAACCSPSRRPFLNSLMPDPTPRISCGIFDEPNRSTITPTMMISSMGLSPPKASRLVISLSLLRNRYHVAALRMVPQLEAVHGPPDGRKHVSLVGVQRCAVVGEPQFELRIHRRQEHVVHVVVVAAVSMAADRLDRILYGRLDLGDSGRRESALGGKLLDEFQEALGALRAEAQAQLDRQRLLAREETDLAAADVAEGGETARTLVGADFLDRQERPGAGEGAAVPRARRRHDGWCPDPAGRRRGSSGPRSDRWDWPLHPLP